MLTDFANLPRFVPSVLSSQAEPGDGGHLVTQELEGKVLLFSRQVHLLLWVRTDGAERLDFQDLSLRDFTRYEGAWSFRAIPAGTRVRYSLRAQPRADLPGPLTGGAFERSALQMLSQLRNEMQHREAVRALPGSNDPQPRGTLP